jgi:hypothetical protein
MERVTEMPIDPSDPELLRDREWLQSSSLAPLFPELRKGIWHTTSIPGLLGIWRDGQVSPNEGQFPYTYPQTSTSFGLLNGLVSLFDFGSRPEEECVTQCYKWLVFFECHQPLTEH